ncbi:MAG: isoprenylcysteine carboxylmethyltransferase family protein [Gemmatimonadetes bacterium]|nr:isoprenylcysteine carboxylmethyltransferase family protein [Gemmatimonadota bacterium]
MTELRALLRSALGTTVFTALVPGTVVWWAPCFLVVGRERCAAAWPPATTAAIPFALFVLGVTAYLACAVAFVVHGRGTPAPWDAPRALVARGLYRFCRNPMYAGIVLSLLAEARWWREPTMLVYAAVAAVAFHIRVVTYEEPTLRRLFGESFASYCARVKRWGVL